MITMASFSEEGVRVLDEAGGWREPEYGEWIDAGDGNFLQINAESYFSGLFQGFAAGILCALFAIGFVAVMVV